MHSPVIGWNLWRQNDTIWLETNETRRGTWWTLGQLLLNRIQVYTNSLVLMCVNKLQLSQTVLWRHAPNTHFRFQPSLFIHRHLWSPAHPRIRVILALYQRYGRHRAVYERNSWDSGFNYACLHCLVIAFGWLLRVFKIKHTVCYASGRWEELMMIRLIVTSWKSNF